jgi:four helix bundle protein
VRDHRKLDACVLAGALVLAVYRSTVAFPPGERFGLVTQMRRSAVSIPASIVEGSARRSEREFTRFLDIAFSSPRELGYYLSLADRLEYMKDDDVNDLKPLQGHVCAALATLLSALL